MKINKTLLLTLLIGMFAVSLASATPFNLTITAPENITYATNTTIYFNVTMETNGFIDECVYSLDGGTVTNVSMTNYTSSIDFNASGATPEGYNTVNFYCNNSDGDTNYTEFLGFTTDVTPPNMTINTPSNKTYNTALMNFNVTTADGDIMGYCWVSLDAGLNNITMSNLSSDYNVTNSTVSIGYYTANFYCNDSVNNINDTMTIDFMMSYGGLLNSTYPFNENSGTIIYDVNGSVNGVLSGATWTIDNVNVTMVYNSDYDQIMIVPGTFVLINGSLERSEVNITSVSVSYSDSWGFHVTIMKLVAGFVALIVLIFVYAIVKKILDDAGVGDK